MTPTWRGRRFTEHGVDEFWNAFGIEALAGHDPPIDDRPSQSDGGEIRVEARGDFAGGHTVGDGVGQCLSPLIAEPMKEASDLCVPFGALDQRRGACREDRVLEDLGQVVQEPMDPRARRLAARDVVGLGLAVQRFEGVGDEGDLVRPVPIDGAAGHAAPAGDRVDGERPIADLGELVQCGFAHDPP